MGHNPPRTELGVVDAAGLLAPPLSAGVSTIEAQEQWPAIWTSAVAAYGDLGCDMGCPVRYIKLYDEWITTRDIIRATPTAKRSRGQIRPHPLGATIQRSSTALGRWRRATDSRRRIMSVVGIDVTVGVNANDRFSRELEIEAARMEVEAMANIDPELIFIAVGR